MPRTRHNRLNAILRAIMHHWKVFVLCRWLLRGRPATNASNSNCCLCLEARFWFEEWPSLWSRATCVCKLSPILQLLLSPILQLPQVQRRHTSGKTTGVIDHSSCCHFFAMLLWIFFVVVRKESVTKRAGFKLFGGWAPCWSHHTDQKQSVGSFTMEQ